jgi:glycosyltransferase involved in cell wall biosynthesis
MGQSCSGASEPVDLGQMNSPRMQKGDLSVAPRILALADWYLPGSKAGGPVSSIANLIELVGDEFHFHVITRDRDLTDKVAYPDVPIDQWTPVGKASVLYTADLSFSNLRRRILDLRPNLIYLNSFFSPATRKVLLLRRFGLLPTAAIVLAPRGEFSPGALNLKRVRKWLYQRAAKRTGLYKDLTWQASSGLEKEHITAAGIAERLPNRGRLVVTPNVPSPHSLQAPLALQRPEKRPGAVRLIFLSRISRKKNLHFALKSLAGVRGHVDLEIVGPVEDAGYWAACRQQIQALPKNILVTFTGPVRHEHVGRLFCRYHFLILPTLGENFGYVILEALAAGCPVLISDQTPWRNLRAAGVGWDLPLGKPALWLGALQECVAMDSSMHRNSSLQAYRLAERWISSPCFQRNSADLFRTALDQVVNREEK